MNKNYSNQKAFWQKYTEDELTDNDIDEINLNLQDFAKAILDIQQELLDKKQKEAKLK